MRSVLLACILIGGAATNAAADWVYASSDHFEVYAAGGDRQARDALNYFERVHAFFTDFMGLALRPGTITRLVVFNGDREFAPYRLNEVTAAYYLSGPDRDVIVMKSLDENAYPIVVHEYAHLIVRHSGLRFPLWLNEGLAEFFSTLAPEGKRMSVGAVPRERLSYLSDRTVMLPLERLFAATPGSAEYTTRTHAGVFYSQSWALTHMLMADARYRGKFREFQQQITNGMPSEAAFAAVYAKTPAAVATDLVNYVQQSRYTYFLADYRSPPPLDKVPTRAVDAFEAELVGANLLGIMANREAEARAAFQKLSAERPEDASLAESRAYFEMRRGRREEARPYFARAVELGSRNASLYRDYAVLEPSRAEELLARAMAIAPTDLEIRTRYARALLVQRKNAEALAVLTAVQGEPQRSSWFQLLAAAYLQTNQLPQAKEAATRAAKYAQAGAEADYVTQLTKSIDEAIAFSARRGQ